MTDLLRIGADDNTTLGVGQATQTIGVADMGKLGVDPTDVAIAQTMQSLPNVRKGEGAAPFFAVTKRGLLLPAWGTLERERASREFFRNPYNTLIQGAQSGQGKRASATPWEINGENQEDVEYFQKVFRDAQFGAGYTTLIEKAHLDFFRQDRGTWIEIIAPGDPMESPIGAVSGLAVLDSIRVYPTGDPTYPAIYYNRRGKMHVIHRSRVIHIVDGEDTDEMHPGVGLCAVSRAAAVMQREILMNKYIEASLDDKPMPGVNLWSNVTDKRLEEIVQSFLARRSMDGGNFWGDNLNVFSMNENKIDMTPVAFSKAPEKFDFQTYVNVDVDEMCAAIGIDRQELMQLSGGTLGSGQQSNVQHEKSKGKHFGNFMARLERAFNDVLPDELEFKLKIKDTEEEKSKAETAQLWTGIAATPVLQPNEQRQLLANQVEAFHDVLTDPNGQLIRVDDMGVQPQTTISVAEDSTPLTATPDAVGAPQTLGIGSTQLITIGKSFDATRREFVDNLVDLISAGNNDEMGRRRFGIVFRAQLRRLGTEAFKDGLEAGGVHQELDPDEQAQVQMWLSAQSGYVTNFANTVYGRGLTAAQVRQHAEMWANKSLQEMYDAGRVASDKNGMYEWVLGKTEHCEDCKRLSGQRHRFKLWFQKAWLPKSLRLECKGYQCQCSLVRTQAPARGRF
jgi:hypothetical protein